MSHFVTFVLVKRDEPEPMREVERLLAPYNENTEVPEYEDRCHCINRVARNDAEEQACKELGNWDDYRNKFNETLTEKEKKLDPWSKEYKKAKINERWKKFTKPIVKRIEKLTKEHPLYNKPDPTCGFYEKDENGHKAGERYADKSGCGGTGKRRTTYNPKSKWDWYAVGGRWTGILGNYDPIKDPGNYETCWLCEGTGKRNDALGKDMRKLNPKYTCNGCDGTGKKLKSESKWPNKGNITTVNDILNRFDEEKCVPFAIITPDGKWYEKGEMLYWGIVSDEKNDKKWTNEVKKLFRANKKCFVINIDCHI
jgi:hypothetical protein